MRGFCPAGLRPIRTEWPQSGYYMDSVRGGRHARILSRRPASGQDRMAAERLLYDPVRGGPGACGVLRRAARRLRTADTA